MNNPLAAIQFIGDHPVFVEGFPAECLRSVSGSLHLYPRKLTEVTYDELSFLKDKRKDIFRLIKVIPRPVEKRATNPVPVAMAEVKEPEVLPEIPKEEPQEESAYEKKWKKKGKGFE